MKTKRLLFCVVLMVLVCSIGSGYGQTSKKPIEISFMHYLAPMHIVQTHMILPWVKMVEEASGGKVKFNVYANALLAKPEDFIYAVSAGTIDMVHGYSGYTPGRFPVSDVSSLPFLGANSAVAASKAFMELWRTFPEIANEWKDVKILWFETHPPMQLHTAKKPVRTLSDLRGLKIKIAGKPAPYLKSLDCTPIIMATPEVYEALSKGVIDGTIYPWTEMRGGARLEELSFYHTEINFYTMPFFVAMNWKKWNSLPADVQAVFEKFGGNFGLEMFAKAWDQEAKDALEWVKSKPKHELISFPRSELEKARDLMKPHYDKWIADISAKGINAKGILDKAIGFSEQYSK